MSVVNNGTKVTADPGVVPSTYTRPVITEFADVQYKRRVTLSVLKATVENATPATTMGAILTNASIGITKQVTDIVTAAFDNAKTVTCFADVVSITSNFPPADSGDNFKNTAFSYKCEVDIYIKSV